MKIAAVLGVMLTLLTGPVWGDEGHHHALTEEEIGSVHFATSCITSVESDFNHAVALLHSFQYEAARSGFIAITSKDPRCAMAQWGLAMSHYHGLWGNGDTVAGREALKKAQQIASANPGTTAREHAYIEALAEIYRENSADAIAHGNGFEQKMAALQSAYPNDNEAAIFHALALAITARGISDLLFESHGVALVKNPVSSAARLCDLAVQTLVRFVRLPALGAGSRPPPLTHSPGMDLVQWERWLDRYTGTRLQQGAVQLLVDGEEFFESLRRREEDLIKQRSSR